MTEHFSLPTQIVTRHDVSRIAHEMDLINNVLDQALLRAPEGEVAIPKMSRMLDECMQQNEVDVHNPDQRAAFQKQLETLRDEAPLAHISFANDPAPAFMIKIAEWFRKEIHPFMLMQIGLQPTITAGFTMRVGSKYYDFSLRKKMERSLPQLVEAISQSRNVQDSAPAVAKTVNVEIVDTSVPEPANEASAPAAEGGQQ